MADRVIDYSAGFPGAANIKRAGYIGAVRYIGTPGNIKCATATELKDFNANGIGMALVFEQYATDWRGGFNAGAVNARRAYDHAKAIGWPVGARPIYMAVDQDVVTESEFASAMSYLRGAASVLGAQWTGVYGEHDVCARAAAEGAARWFWQCRAWSGTPVRLFAGRHLYQHAGYVTVGGIQCDYNDVLRPDWGQHLEDDMPLDANRDYEALKTMMQRFFAYEARPGGAAATHVNGPTIYEQLGAIRSTLAAVANDPDITPAELERVVDAAVERHTPTPEQVAAAQLPHIKDAVRAVLGEDNIDQAEQIVDELTRRLANTSPTT